MPQSLSCPCGTALAITPELVGKQVRCPSCDRTLDVPLQQEAAPVETAGDSHAEMAETNPFAPTIHLSPMGAAAVGSDAEVLRRKHIKQEASIKSIGTLYYFGAGLIGFAAAAMITRNVNLNAARAESVISSLIFLALAAGLFLIGRGLRNLSQVARVIATVFISFGVLRGVANLPFGLLTVLIGLYLIYLLWGRHARLIFSSEYRLIIEQTPDIKYKTSLIVRVFAGILLAFLGLILVGLFTF